MWEILNFCFVNNGKLLLVQVPINFVQGKMENFFILRIKFNLKSIIHIGMITSEFQFDQSAANKYHWQCFSILNVCLWTSHHLMARIFNFSTSELPQEGAADALNICSIFSWVLIPEDSGFYVLIYCKLNILC